MTGEIPEQPGRVPVGESRELVEEMRGHADTEFDGGKGKYAATVQRKWARQLEEVIDRYE